MPRQLSPNSIPIVAILPADRLQKVPPKWEFAKCYRAYSRLFRPTDTLAHSSRLLALLMRRGLFKQPTMTLVETSQMLNLNFEEKKPFVEPLVVVTTPCDPWPRPYYLDNGLRRVAPYHFTYNTYCKERWRGRELLDIFVSEFRDRPAEYYVRCLFLKALVED
jgi:hypothetical protein